VTHEDQPWAWDEARWRGYVERVRAGRSLKPHAWPGGAEVAVALSFDSDHETIPLRNGETHPGKLSQGEYGARVAVPRILRLLDHHRVPASFFVPAVSALLHPGEIGACVAAGHEIAAQALFEFLMDHKLLPAATPASALPHVTAPE